jgi:hypothetical protein
MKLKNSPELNTGLHSQYKEQPFYPFPSYMDGCAKSIMLYLINNAFHANFISPEEDQRGWMTMASFSSLARGTNFNPKTIQSRIKLLIDKEAIEVIDVYPKTGRALVSIYRIPFKE